MSESKHQRELFANEIARHTDPETSHVAAAEIGSEGIRGRMCALAIALMRQHPGCTANELEELAGLKDGQLRKRLNDLRNAGQARVGPVRVSRVTGRLNETWYLPEP